MILRKFIVPSFYIVLATAAIFPAFASAKANEIDRTEATELFVKSKLDTMPNWNKSASEFNKNFAEMSQPVADAYYSQFGMVVRVPLGLVASVETNLEELTVGSVGNMFAGRPNDSLRSVVRPVLNGFGLIGGADFFAQPRARTTDELKKMNPVAHILNELRSRKGISWLKQPELSRVSQAFHEWGFGCGNYIVIPLLGGTTAQNMLGAVVEMPLQASTYVPVLAIMPIAKGLDDSMTNVHTAKTVLEEWSKSESGKTSFYEANRQKVLVDNKCIDSHEVDEFAKEQGFVVVEDAEMTYSSDKD